MLTALALGALVALPLQERAAAPEIALGRDHLEFLGAQEVEWTERWHAGELGELLESLEADLESGDPHPYATWLWLSALERDGADLEAVAAASPASRVLAAPARARALRTSGREEELLAAYDPAAIASVTDLATLAEIEFAADAADDLGRHVAVVERLLTVAPRDWWGVWSAIGLIDSDERGRVALLASCAPGTALGAGAAAEMAHRYATWAPAHDDWSRAARSCVIELAREWIDAYPWDWGAHACLGLQLASAYDQEGALAALSRAAWLGPWRVYADRAARELVDLGRVDDARALLAAWTGAEGDALKLQLAESCVDSGAPGFARPLLAELVAGESDARGGAHALFASIELAAGRAERAAEHARAAVGDDPADVERRHELFRALVGTANRAEALALGAGTAADLAAGAVGDVRALVSDYADALEEDGDVAGSAALHRRLVDAWPGTAWTWRALAGDLAALGRHDEARAAIDEALVRQPWSAWAIARAAEWAELEGGRDAALAQLAALIDARPTVRPTWLALLARHADDPARELELLEDAAARLPGRAWPIEERADGERADDPERALERLAALTDPARPMDIVIRDWRLAFFVRRALVQAGAPVEGWIDAFDDAVERCLRLGFDRDDLFHERGWVRNWQGDRAGTAAAWMAASRAKPNDSGWATNLKHLDLPAELGAGVVNARLADVVARDPYDGERVNDVAHYFAKWGGSPVEVVRLADWLREELPEAFRTGRAQRELGEVLGRLGDSRGGFERRYGRARYVGTSERYIAWYERSRDAALEDDWTRVEFDTAEGTYTVTRADGTREARGHHPLSGSLTLARSGAAWIRAEYADPFGELLGALETSAGRRVALGYDDERRLVRVEDSDGVTVEFDYRAGAARAEVIRVVGRGELRVEYDADGEQRSVTAVGAGGGEPAVDLEALYMGAMGDLMGLAAQLRSGDLSGLLPPHPEEARLADAIERAGDYRGQVTATLALARWLATNTATRPGAAADAALMLENLWGYLSEDSAPWELETLADVARVQRALDRARNPEGLTNELAWEWSWRRGSLEALADEHDDDGLRAVLAEFDAEPLALLPSQRWLPRSDLSNDAFWRGFGPADLVPSRVAAELVPQVALARANGDVLVGSNLGLHVRRAGWWRWYAWDERAGALVPGDADAPRSAASSVHALAEEPDGGRLWIGTANGLLELDGDGDYAQPARRRVTPAQGLPTPAVDHLAAWNGGVVVGTARGATHVTADGARALAEAPIRRLASEELWSWYLTVDREALIEALDLEPGVELDEQLDALDRALAEEEDLGPLLAELHPDAADEEFQWSFWDEFTLEGEDTDEVLLVLTDRAWLEFDADGGERVLFDGPLEDFAVDFELGSAWALERQRVLGGDWTLEGSLTLRSLAGQADLVTGGRIHSLAVAPADADGYWSSALCVLTDAGVALWTGAHFEHLALPGGDPAVGARDLVWTWNERFEPSWFVVTTDGLRAFERGDVAVTRGSVRDLATAPAWGLTFVAFDDWNGLWAVDHVDGEAVPFASVEATALAVTPQGNLVTNDRNDVVVFDVGSTTWRRLFDATPTDVPGFEESWAFGVKDLLVDSDGTVWALSGGSVFRWRDGAVDEFSWAVDPERFPSETWTVASLLRGPDGRLYAVGSDERHVTSRGQALRGGLLAFDAEADRFERVHDAHWGSSALFWLSYTDVGDGVGIVGTTDDFYVLEDGAVREPLEDSESYRALYDADPRLWLGTEGVSLGDGTWLFGCARGLVGWRDGTWFAADRLERTLPDQELGPWGARHVTALATDPSGRLYVGTSRGLTVHSGGVDATRLMMDAGLPDVAASDVERAKLRDQAEVLLAGLEGADDPAAVRLRELIKSRERIAALTRANDAGGLRVAEPRGGREAVPEDVDRELRREQAAYNRRLREIEFSDPVLAQLLELAPLDLAAAARRLPSGVAVLQLMPSRGRLYLNLVTAERTLVREVEVPRDELFARCDRAATLLRESVADLSRGSFLSLATPAAPAPVDDAAKRLAELRDLLAWLYDHALRPVEGELDGVEVLLVSPSGALAQIPPAALLRRDGDVEQYAIERYQLGVLTDLHKLELGVTAGLLGPREALVVGDPDATLPGARAEARRVHALLGSERTLLIGDAATFENIALEGDGASILHLATHGRIDVDNPVDSHLVLASGERMMVYDICTLPFELADLAVLSACESGVGPAATAYGSLASAFLNAGVPLTVATLWQVSDRWSGELVERFYAAYAAGADPHAALAGAQRALIAEHGPGLPPSAWAGYVLFGVPAR